MKKWIIRVLIVGIVVFLIARIFWPSLVSYNTDLNCAEKEEMIEYFFNAVVIKKFNDPENHNYPAIVFKSLTDDNAYKIFFILEKGGFFDNIQVGDTVKKQSGSLRKTSSNKKNSRLFSLSL